ncbi:MAG: hypothetical protein CMJ78_11730, partial [Planctomycetaceae bacterium]|nr:hypothetical protein [Planctomycetaceae bacterium]
TAVLTEDGRGRTSRFMGVSGHHNPGQLCGLGILTHPKSTSAPYRWLLRHYGMQNVIFPGRKPLKLPKDELVTLRHRLVIHRGNDLDARVAEQQAAFELLDTHTLP